MRSLRLICWGLLWLALEAGISFAGHTERISMSGRLAAGNGVCDSPVISADGRFVAFASVATDLVIGDTNAATDVFVRDRQTGIATRVSVKTGGGQANGSSSFPALSADGRYVAFTSVATDLVADDTNAVTDVFVRDRQLGVTTRVSVASDGTQANAASGFASISADGRYVAFSSLATNLVAGDTNAQQDIFVHDQQTGQTERVSVASGGAQATGGHNYMSTISSDGRYVVFESAATNLVAADTNGQTDLFLRDRQLAETTRVSVATGGTQAVGGSSLQGRITADGRYVVFESLATNLVAGDTNGKRDIFVRDRQTGETTRVSVAGDGTQADGESTIADFSADGRFIVFGSSATNLVAGDTNALSDVFLRDRTTGATTRISLASDGSEATGGASGFPALSADGRYVAFWSQATNLAAGDTNGAADIYGRDVATGETVLISAATQEANGASYGAAVSGDGRFVAFQSDATNLVANDANAVTDVFVRDRQAGEVTLASVASDGTQGNSTSLGAAVSGDGRYVAFQSWATNLVPGDTNNVRDVFVHDRQTGETTRVSVATDGTQGDKESATCSISGNGRYVAFASSATNLVAGDTNGLWDVFVRDLQTGATTRESVAPDGGQAVGGSSGGSLALSADGRYVAFYSEATNLVAGDTNGCGDYFVRDRQTGVTTRVSVASDGTQADAALGSGVAISADGSVVAFESPAKTLVPGDTNEIRDVFVHDLRTGETTRVSVSSDGVEGAGGFSIEPDISADGRYVAFSSACANLVAGDTNGQVDVFVHDRATGVTTRVSAPTGGDKAEGGGSNVPAISADGRYVAFESGATNLVPGDTNKAHDIFLRERPHPDLSSSARDGVAPLTVGFTDHSTGEPTAWAWDFGDGTASTDQSPSHQYGVPGRYSVTLTARDECDQMTETWARWIRVTFTDVPFDQWAVDEVLACVEAGIVTGYPDLTYQPAGPVTRDQMAVYIARALAGGDAHVPSGPAAASFPDVPTNYWAFSYVEYAKGRGVVTGYPDGSYQPRVALDRGQMAVFVARAMANPVGEPGLASYTPPASPSFPDVPTGFWSFKYVEYIKAQNVTGGYPDGNYHPEVGVTRDQMAVYVARAFDLIP